MANRDVVLTAGERALQDQTNLLRGRQLYVTLAALSITLLICFFDQNGISVMLPTIAADLDAGETISWAGTSSLIANTVFQMLYGRLSDIFGRKNVFLAAIACLCIADLLCGLSQNPAMLYVFRAVAGIGGGGITNLTMIMLSDIVTLEQRGNYQGILGAMVGLGNVVGPFLGAGFIKSTTWRAFFYMLSPLAAVVGVAAYFLLPESKTKGTFGENVRKIDYLGCFTSSLGVIMILIPISGGGAYFPWDSALVISFLVIGGLSLLIFPLVEWKSKLPMMPITIFHSTPVTVLLIQSFLLGAAYQSYLYYVPLYLQNAHQYSVIVSAAIYISSSVVQSISSILSGLYISHTKRYGEVVWFAFTIWTLGSGLTLLYARSTNPGVIVVPLILTGAGVGCAFQPTLVALQAHSPKSRRAVITSNRNFFRCGGGAVGLAVSATILQAALKSHLPAKYAYMSKSVYSLPSDIGSLADGDKILDAYMYASHAVFLFQLPLAVLCLLGCIFVRDKGLDYMDRPQESEKKAAEDEPGALEEGVQASSTEGGTQAGSTEETQAGSAGEEKKTEEAGMTAGKTQ